MSERDFWLTIRSALIMVCKAIERRYLGGVQSSTPAAPLSASVGTPAPTFAQPSTD